MVTARQLCEHLKPEAIPSVLKPGSWDVMIIRGASLTATHVRIDRDRIHGGFLVTHGKYRELRQLDARGPMF